MSSYTKNFNASNASGFNSGNPFQMGMINSKNSVMSSVDMTNQNFQFLFKERIGRLKWKDIMKIDLEMMIRNNDLSPLENYLENLIFSSVDENDLQIVPETHFLKLVKIFQHVLEYLLFTQQRLENENKNLETNYNQLINDAMYKEAQLKENKNIIQTLKKDKKQKEMVLNTYKCLIDEYKSGQIINPQKVNEMVTKKYFYCNICEGKKFSSQENLESHIDRRHHKENLHHEEIIKVKESDIKIDTKLDEMKSFFETYIKNFQSDSYTKIYENQKNLENKITEIKYEKNNEIKEIESQFKSTLVEMKDMYLKNVINIMGSTNQNFPQVKKESEDDHEKAAKKLKKETKKMNEKLKEINGEQNEKIGEIMKQLNSFKQTITDEFKEIKENKKNENIENVVKVNKISIPVIKEFNPQVENTINVELTNSNRNQKNLIRDSIHHEQIKPKKVLFNSGPLESDNESDNETVLKNKSVTISSELRNRDVKFSFAPNTSISMNKLNLDNEVSPFTKNKIESENFVKNSILQSIERDINNISTLPEAVSSPLKKRQDSINEEFVNNGEPNEKVMTSKPVKRRELEKKIVEITKEEIPEVNNEDEELKPIPNNEPDQEIKNTNQNENINVNNNEIENNLIKSIQKNEEIKPVQLEEVSVKPINDNKINQIEKEQSLDEVKKFYHSFVERDNNAVGVENPLSENLIVSIIPEKPTNYIDSQMRTYIENASKQIRKEINSDRLKEIPQAEVILLIDDVIKNIQKISDNRDFFQIYYSNISNVVGLEDCLNFVKNKKINRNYLPIVNNTKANFFSTTIKAKINEKDELVPSPIEEKLSDNKHIEEDNEVKIIDDDQFDHEF